MKDLKILADDVLSRLKIAGADDGGVKISSGYCSELNVDGGEISLLRTIFSDSVAIKVIKDKRKGTITINSFDDEEIDEAVRLCMESVDAGIADDAVSISPLTENGDFEDGINVPDKEKLFMRLQEYMEDMARDYPQIIIEQVIVTYSYGEFCLANTNGVCYTSKGGSYSFSSMFSAHDGDKTTSFNSVGFDLLDLDKPFIEMYGSREYYDRCIKELDAKPLEGKFVGKVLASPDMVSEFVGTAIGCFMSDGPLIEKTSPWIDKLGEKVVSEKLTVRSIPLDERMICSSKIHADGYKNENADYITDGVLKAFDLSDYGAKKTGGVRFPSSSGCTEIPGGKTPLQDLIKSIDKGIFICRFSGGEPASNGDFSGVAKNSFMIENGEITHALTETMISGNIEDMLNNIIDFSSETVCDGSSVLPYGLFDGLTVSGK